MRMITALVAALLFALPAVAEETKCQTVADSLNALGKGAKDQEITILAKTLDKEQTAKWVAEMQKNGLLQNSAILPETVLIFISSSNPYLAVAVGYGPDGCAFGVIRQASSAILEPLGIVFGVKTFDALGFVKVVPTAGA